MRLFISHINEERAIAKAISEQLYSCFGAQVDTFLAEDIPLGTNWFDQIKVQLGQCDVILVMFSRFSCLRPWINIEASYGVMSGKHVIPICHSGFKKNDLPVIYRLLQAVDPLVSQEVDRLLDQIAKGTHAGKFLGDKTAAVTRWIQEVSNAVRSTPRFTPPITTPPCIWIIGSNRDLKKSQADLNKRFIRLLATAFMQRRFRVVFGRSGLLDTLGDTMNSRNDPEQIYGIDCDALSEFANASAMQRDSATAPPNPIVILGSLRSTRGVGEIFAETIGCQPDAVVIIGGSLSGRTREEIDHAINAGIAVLPLHFTGGVAATIESSIDTRLADTINRIHKAQRDYSSIAQLICDVLEKQTAIRRNSCSM